MPRKKKTKSKPKSKKAKSKPKKSLEKESKIDKKSVLKNKEQEESKVEVEEIKRMPDQKALAKQVSSLRKPIQKIVEGSKHPTRKLKKEYVQTGVEGLDQLMRDGIPKGSSVIVAGGTGSGKTILGLQMMNYAANKGEKCLYMSFEENEKRLRQHMEDFGWDPRKLEKKGLLKIQRVSTFDVSRSVDALLAKAKGELLIELDPLLIEKDFNPNRIVIDSLTAIAAAFVGKDESYRIYIEQLFRFLEKLKATTFLITETEQIPTKFSPTGVEEFLADGVIVLYSTKTGNIRENAIEVLKLRGAKHEKKIVVMHIEDTGLKVYPTEELFGGLGPE